MSGKGVLSEDRLAEIEARLGRATPGPWAYKDRLGGGGCFVFSEDTFHVVAVEEDDEAAVSVPLGGRTRRSSPPRARTSPSAGRGAGLRALRATAAPPAAA